jgi:adenosine deaminase
VPPEGLTHHIRDAIEIAGAERIGHGVDIVYEKAPLELIQEMRAKNVAVEINLTSNDFILGVKGEAHPVTIYARYGVPLVISTDDAGVSRNNLTGEYVLLASRYRFSYDDIKRSVYNSIEYSFMNKEEKARNRKRLDDRYLKFESDVAKFTAGTDSGIIHR